MTGAGVLLVGAVRREDEVTVARLSDRAIRLRLEPLPSTAVEALAAAAGLSAHASEVLARTAGHSLSVVEYLRALAAGDTGVPESLAAAIEARVDRLPPAGRELVQGASVLHGRLDPRLLGDLVGIEELAAVRLCEEVAVAGLLHPVGAHYEFVNDLAQECVYRSLAPPLVSAYHRRAADLLSDQPESMAEHAYAAGEHGRAAQGWLLAGQAAMGRSAVEDAIGLYDRALAAAEEPLLRARVLLARARAEEASTAYAAALADIDEALALARAGPDRRLEMAALRARGGDVPVALRLPSSEVGDHLEAGLRLATGLGDRAAEADFTTRLTVLEASRLRLASALTRAEAGLARARASSSEEAIPFALDGVKTVLGYLGEGDRLREVVAELVPQLRRLQSAWLLQWAVFDSSFAAAAEGAWEEAQALVEEALEINRNSGFRAYTGYFRAHSGWFARLAGDLETAVARGRTAVAETSPVDHPWWYAAAAGLLSCTLLETGESAEAESLARRGLTVAGPAAPEAWRLRCLAPLAATDGPGGDNAFAESRRLLGAIECPPGKAWVPGADCYLQVARAAERRGDVEGAAGALAPLRTAVDQSWASVRQRVDAQLGQISSATS
jgi:tetratricopeptide (TPR) repeat protein